MRTNRKLPSTQTSVGLGWYSREQWNRLRELADDKESLDETYEDWLKGWHRFMKNSPIPKDQLQKIEVNVDDLSSWCKVRNRPLDRAARSEYVAEKVDNLSQI